MEFKTPSEPQVVDTLALAGGGLGGAMASRAVVGLIHTAATGDAAAIKKDENTLLLKRGALAAAGIVLAVFVSGKDTGTSLVKGAGIGMAFEQTLEVVKTLAARNGVIADPMASTGKKALANAVGLGCGCGNSGLNGRKRTRNRRGLNAPVPMYTSSNMDMYAPANTAMGLPVGGGLDALTTNRLMN